MFLYRWLNLNIGNYKFLILNWFIADIIGTLFSIIIWIELVYLVDVFNKKSI